MEITSLVVIVIAAGMTVAPPFMMAVGVNTPDESPEAVETWFVNKLPHAKEKLIKLHFYFNDKVSGNHPTAVEVARANLTSSSPYSFGQIRVFDDPLTVGPEPNSTLIGYGQGIYAKASHEDLSMLFTFNFVFINSEYNGSTITVQGRNSLPLKYRELSVVGGSGVFRLARGSAVASTYSANATLDDGIVEFTVFVLHYGNLDDGFDV